MPPLRTALISVLICVNFGEQEVLQLAEALPRGLQTLLASKMSLHGDSALAILTAIGAGVRVLDLSHNLCMTPTDAVVSLPAFVASGAAFVASGAAFGGATEGGTVVCRASVYRC